MTESSRPHAPVSVQLRGLLPDLQPSLARVASVILADVEHAADLSISELADKAETSETTVMRLCRQLGLRGYPQLRLALAKEDGYGSEVPPQWSPDIDPDDPLESLVHKLAYADSQAIQETAQLLSIEELQRAVDAMVGAQRIDVYGVGASAFVAHDLQQKLHRIGQVSFAWSDPHLAMTSAAVLSERDVAIAISHTGATKDTIEALQEARSHGATTIAITNSPRSVLASIADIRLHTAARETTFRSGAMASRLAQLTVIDFLFVGVAQRDYERSARALARTAEAVRDKRTGPAS